MYVFIACVFSVNIFIQFVLGQFYLFNAGGNVSFVQTRNFSKAHRRAMPQNIIFFQNLFSVTRINVERNIWNIQKMKSICVNNCTLSRYISFTAMQNHLTEVPGFLKRRLTLSKVDFLYTSSGANALNGLQACIDEE